MKKFSLLIIILCTTIIGTVITGCGASKTNTGSSIEQTDKNTLEESNTNYEIKEYSANGINFSYPVDWVLDDSNESILLIKPTADNPNNMSMNFMVTQLDTEVPSYSEYVDILKPGMEDQFIDGSASVEEYKVGVNSGAKFIMEDEVDGIKLKMMQIHIFQDKQVAIFTYGGEAEGYDYFIDQVNYITSSFKS